MQTDESDLSWVRGVFVHQFEIAEASIRPDARLREDLRLESLDLVDLILEVERRVGRRIEGEDMSGVRTVEDVLTLVARLRAH